MSVFRNLVSAFVFAGISGLAMAQELPPLDPEPGRGSTEPTTSSAKQDVVVKGFMPDWQVSRMVREAFDEVEKTRKEKPIKTTAEKKTSDQKKTPTAQKSGIDTKAASLIAEPAKVGTLATPEDKAVAKKAQEAADRANGIVRDQKTTAKTAAAVEGTRTASAKKVEQDSKPVALDDRKEVDKAKVAKSETTRPTAKPKQPGREDDTPKPEKTVVRNIEIAPGKNMTVKSSVKGDAEQARPLASDTGSVTKTGRNGQLQVTGRVVSVSHGRGGRLRVLIDAGDEGSVQALIEPRIGMRAPQRGSVVSASGKRIGGSGNSIVMRAESFTSRSGAGIAASVPQKRYRPEVAEVPPPFYAPPGGMSLGLLGVDLSVGHFPPPVYGPPMMGRPMLPPPSGW